VTVGGPDLSDFLGRLDSAGLSYRLDRVRDAIMVHVAIPGERWEVEFMDAGGVEVERFRSDGLIQDDSSFDELFAREEAGR
jgi:hypothetical protein